ncbi:MAG: hypothetical protein E7001_03990 [Coriobacteriaceae bacterium]|nr:hypothetical protein [Coriobacteriaceae bacterium]
MADFARGHLPTERIRPLADRLHAHIPNSIYVVGEGRVIFLTSRDDAFEESACDQEGIAGAVAGTPIRVGISGVFTGLDGVRTAIGEAVRAIEVGGRLTGGHVWAYARPRLADLVDRALSEKTATSYLYPPLMLVIEHDAATGSALARTLLAHLRAGADADAAAEVPFIHKNTLYYRLERIRELMGGDFRDGETVAQIMVSFTVLRAQGRLDAVLGDAGARGAGRGRGCSLGARDAAGARGRARGSPRTGAGAR